MTLNNSNTSAPLPSENEPRRSSTKRIAGLLILIGLLIFLLWAGLKSWRVYQATRSLMALEPEARSLMSGGIKALNPDAAEALVLRAREDIAALHSELAIVKPLTPYLGWVPRFGPAITGAPYLLEMADAGSEAAVLAVSSLKPALAIIQQPDFGAARMGELLPILSNAAPDLQLAQDSLDRYSAAREGLNSVVEIENLPWRVRQLLELSDQWLPIATDGIRLAPGLPALLGHDGPRNYLILAQNEDELRATGGFITGVGVVTVQDGRIIDLSFRDAYQVDKWAEKPYAFPPQPYYDFLGLELFLFRDANFWPDFPTSAQKAIDLYVYGQGGPQLDGAIAIDQEFLRILVDAIGPVPVPGTDQTINADNLLKTLRAARDIQEGQEVGEWVGNRKAFLGGFAAAILAKIETDFGSIDPVRLARNMTGAAENRHLSIYMTDPNVAAALAENGWDGHIPPTAGGDFWMAVDTNMGYNKVNIFIERAFSYEISLEQSPQALMSIQYRHTGPASDEPCLQGVEEEFEQAAEYLALADKCYWNYLRLYVPAGSQLMESSRHVVPGDTMISGKTWDRGGQVADDLPWLTTFSNFMLVPHAAETTVYFRYQLPPDILESVNGETVYRLSIGKQPGTSTEPTNVSIILPDGAEFIGADPMPTQVEGNRIVYALDLTSDVSLIVRYR